MIKSWIELNNKLGSELILGFMRFLLFNYELIANKANSIAGVSGKVETK